MQIFENFISYRRSETLPEVQNIYHALTNKGLSTFCDIYTLNSGRFDNNLLEIIKRCTNYILVINNHSLDRCNDENDWLRFEISTALKFKKNIICVFVGDFDLHQTLPEDIDEIRYYNGIKYDFIYFDSFIDAICSRFMVKDIETETSNEKRDFVIHDSVLVKYVGVAPIVVIPKGIKIIGEYAFKDKTQVTKIVFPEGMEKIEKGAFERCINISNLVFPDSLRGIGDKAFMRCYNLSFIAFNDELTSIGDEAFCFCEKLKVVRFGKGIASIASSAFNDCDKLAIFDVDKENLSFSTAEGILYDKDKKRIIRCPEGYNNDLVTVHDTVEKIEPWCFSKCIKIVDIVLPKHLKKIGAYAFSFCRNIISLTLGDEIEEFDVSALEGWSNKQRVVVSKRFNPLIKYNIQQKINEKANLQQNNEANIIAFVMVKTTFESIEEASKMAKMLVDNNYVASAQLNKLNVFYTWNDEPCNENEIELSCITRGDLYNKVEEFILQHHSYECCQIICLPIVNTSKAFGEWIIEQTEHKA